MLTDEQITRLKANWGDRVTSLACMAEVRVHDPRSSWQVFLLAINPDDMDEIACIFDGFTVEVDTWRLSDLMNTYNGDGEPPIVDLEFRPRRAAELFKKLNEKGVV